MGKDSRAKESGGKGKGKQAAGGSDDSASKGKGKAGKADGAWHMHICKRSFVFPYSVFLELLCYYYLQYTYYVQSRDLSSDFGFCF